MTLRRRWWADAIASTVEHAVDAGVVGSKDDVPRGWWVPRDGYPTPSGLVRFMADRLDPRELPVDPSVPGLAGTFATGAVFRSARRITPSGLEITRARAPRPSDARFATVIVRTQGLRNGLLEEALTSLAGQTFPGFDVVLAVHSSDGQTVDGVHSVADAFAKSFRSRVSIVAVEPGTRGAPLNVGLDHTTGDYVTFLDDDDVVTGNWMEVFRDASRRYPGRVVRSNAAVVPIRACGEPPGYTASGPFDLRFDQRFDLARHLVDNSTPIFSIAVPRRVATTERFDEDLQVMEDWDFLMRCVWEAGLVDTGHITGVYRWWESGESSLDQEGEAAWESARALIRQRLERSRPRTDPAVDAMKGAGSVGVQTRSQGH